MLDLFKKVFGMGNDAQLKPIIKQAEEIEKLELQFAKLSDSELAKKTEEFKARYANGETLDQLLPDRPVTRKTELTCRIRLLRPIQLLC